MAELVYPDGKIEVVRGTKTKAGALTLEQAQKAVEGYVEGITDPETGKHFALCNEEGLYAFPEDQVNEPAIARIAAHFGCHPTQIVPLRGPILFVEDRQGNWY